jgi:hypothetical protein
MFNRDTYWTLGEVPDGVTGDMRQEVISLFETYASHVAVHMLDAQTVTHGLNDSPAGMLAWILQRWRKWSDKNGVFEDVFDRDFILTNATIYWGHRIDRLLHPLLSQRQPLALAALPRPQARDRGAGRVHVPDRRPLPARRQRRHPGRALRERTAPRLVQPGLPQGARPRRPLRAMGEPRSRHRRRPRHLPPAALANRAPGCHARRPHLPGAWRPGGDQRAAHNQPALRTGRLSAVPAPAPRGPRRQRRVRPAGSCTGRPWTPRRARRRPGCPLASASFR